MFLHGLIVPSHKLLLHQWQKVCICASSVKRFYWNIHLLILIFHPEDLGAGTPGPNNFCSSSTEGLLRTWQPGETNDPIN
jgi:hypothetical protein